MRCMFFRLLFPHIVPHSVSGISSCLLSKAKTLQIPCLKQATRAVGCQITDYKCVCERATGASSKDHIFANVAKPCTLKECGIKDASIAQAAMTEVCKQCVWKKDEL